MKITLALACACGFALSRRLWLSSVRDYPHAPVAEFLAPPRYPLDFLWLGALFLLLALVVISTRPRKYLVAFLVLAGLLALWDQSRWQSWFFQYYFMLAALCLYPWGEGARAVGRRGEGREERRAAALNACRLIAASIYFWGGVQKLNPAFGEMMLFLVRRGLPQSWGDSLPPAATLLVPAVEIFVGLGLLARRTRHAAVALAVATHAAILLLLVPSGSNTVVWPWNVAMPASVLLLFWRARDFSAGDVLLGARRPLNLAVTVLFGVMPALSFAGLWDSYLSAALYSGATKEAFVRFGEPVRGRLPARVQRAVRREGDTYVLHVGLWSLSELNVPAYPEERIYRRVARHVCGHAGAPGDVTVEIREHPSWWNRRGRRTTLDCGSLDR